MRYLFKKLILVFVAALLGGGVVVAAMAQLAEEPAAGETPAYIFPKSGPFSPEKVAVPNADFIAAWSRSGHSDASAEAFAHWNEEGEIPPACSVCHSGAGFRDFHGLDGSEKGLPQNPIPTGGVVDCDTCHNPNLASVTEITLPSGVNHPVNGGEAPCLTCHQGRSAGVTVENAVSGKGDDTVDADLRYINPHYAIAGATWLGGYGGVGYHYPGKPYSGRFLHAKPVATCVSCHDPHSLEVEEQICLTCHTEGDAADIRISRQSYDGSGDTSKGIRADIDANAERLQAAIMDYAANVAGTPIIYDGSRYPYFYADANGDGVIDEAEGRTVAYGSWTPRLLKAVYNWKVVVNDPGVHVHNPHYALELLYDALEDLGKADGMDVQLAGLQR